MRLTHPAAPILALLLFLLLHPLAQAQTPTHTLIPPDAEYPFKRDIEKGKYDKAYEKIQRRISRDSNNLECHYAAYWLFCTQGCPFRNLDSAYHHLLRVRNLYAKANEKELERWARDSYSGARIDYDLLLLGQLALTDAHHLRTPDAYQRFLNHYTLVPRVLRDSATNSRDSLEFHIARRAGSIQTLQDFIDRRPEALVLNDAVRMRDSLAFDEADAQHTYAAYQHFRVAYPHSHLFQRATDSVYFIDYRDVLLHNSEQYYRGYAERYPASPFSPSCLWMADSIEYQKQVDTTHWQSILYYLDTRHHSYWADSATLCLARYALQHQHLTAAEQAIQRTQADFPLHDELVDLIHHLYIHTSIGNYKHFYQSPYGKLVSADQRQADSLAYYIYSRYDYSIIDSCIRLIAPCHEAYRMLQQLLQDDIDHHRWSHALAIANNYADCFADDYDYRQLLSILQAKPDPSIKSSPLGPTINSAKGDEYAPVISSDGRTLYFAARNRTDNIGGDDIFIARRNGPKWSAASIALDLSHTYGNEAPVSISTDGNSLLLSQSGILTRADRTSDGWQTQRLPEMFNQSVWQSDIMLAANGQAILFAAMKQTAHEVDSSLNLYVSLLDSMGNWSLPIELGHTVNSPFNERSPYLHPDMRTLYFSSEGHGSLGQMDVYVTTRLDDTWIHWSTPINIGKGFNTSGDDWGYKVTTDGSKAYFSRHENNSLNLYAIPIPTFASPKPVVIVTGTVKDSRGTPVSTTIYWESLSTGQTLGECRTYPMDGTLSISLPIGDSYGLFVSDNRYFPTSHTVDLTLSEAEAKNVIHLVTDTYQHIITDSLPVTLHGVTFAPSNPQYAPSSLQELQRIARIIKQHKFKVTIESHMDGNEGDAANLALTQQRADAIRDYLIDHGCRPSDITAIGYGSDKTLPFRKSDRSRPNQRRVVLRLTRE